MPDVNVTGCSSVLADHPSFHVATEIETILNFGGEAIRSYVYSDGKFGNVDDKGKEWKTGFRYFEILHDSAES